MGYVSRINRIMLGGFVICVLTWVAFVSMPFAKTETEPAFSPSLKAAIEKLDAKVDLRDDGLVTFSNGTQYVLISPETAQPVDQITLSKTLPSNTQPPDIIVFNDGHYLLHIIKLNDGRKSFPILDNLPLSVRNGLLPQDFSFPKDFLIPTVWKALTGDLLIPGSEKDKQQTNFPLAIFSAPSQTLFNWDLAQNGSTSHVPVPCHPAKILSSVDAKQVLVGCSDRPDVYSIDFNHPDKPLQTYILQGTVNNMVLDKATNQLFISHPNLAQISVINLSQHLLESPITLGKPVRQLTLSPFRQELYAVSILNSSPPKKPNNAASATSPKAEKPLHFWQTQAPQAVVQKPMGNLQIVNLSTLKLEKTIPILPQTTLLTIQDEKVLWMISDSEKVLYGFDLRWQEFTRKIPLPEVPIAMGTDHYWLYLLFPKQNAIGRMTLNTQQWGEPIVLQQNGTPQGMVLDNINNDAYVLSSDPAGVEVVNLNRGQWVGTETMTFQGTGQMTWLIPDSDLPSDTVRIKFANGRLLLQNGPKPQSEKSQSDPHDQPKTHTPPAQTGSSSDPVTMQ